MYSMEGARGRREESNFGLQEVASDRAEVKYEILHLAQLLLRGFTARLDLKANDRDRHA